MINTRIFIGMPLWYAKSVLAEKNIPCHVTETKSRSHFFTCDEHEIYVIRARYEEGEVHFLVNCSLKKSDSVSAALQEVEP